jgi:hypothetical protein
MTIEIKQICNGCGDTRSLNPDFGSLDLKYLGDLAEVQGWCEVKTNKHLCAKCIKAAISRNS